MKLAIFNDERLGFKLNEDGSPSLSLGPGSYIKEIFDRITPSLLFTTDGCFRNEIRFLLTNSTFLTNTSDGLKILVRNPNDCFPRIDFSREIPLMYLKGDAEILSYYNEVIQDELDSKITFDTDVNPSLIASGTVFGNKYLSVLTTFSFKEEVKPVTSQGEELVWMGLNDVLNLPSLDGYGRAVVSSFLRMSNHLLKEMGGDNV